MKKIARSGITSADSVGKDSAPLDPLPPEVFPPPLELLSVVPDHKNILEQILMIFTFKKQFEVLNAHFDSHFRQLAWDTLSM